MFNQLKETLSIALFKMIISRSAERRTITQLAGHAPSGAASARYARMHAWQSCHALPKKCDVTEVAAHSLT